MIPFPDMSPGQRDAALREADSPLRIAVARSLRNAFFEQQVTDKQWEDIQSKCLVTLSNFEVSLAALGLKLAPITLPEPPPITNK